jgi:hypothetical protein
MRNLIKIAAVVGALLGGVTASQAQSGQQLSTEAGVDNAQSHGGYGYGGAYARYGGHYRYHRHYR